MEIKGAHWVHKDVNYGGTIISHECYCSNCGYVAMRYSHMIYDFRAGRPFSVPNYNYCPNCGENMEKFCAEKLNVLDDNCGFKEV